MTSDMEIQNLEFVQLGFGLVLAQRFITVFLFSLLVVHILGPLHADLLVDFAFTWGFT